MNNIFFTKINMREATKEERNSVKNYIEKISIPTNVNFFSLLDEIEENKNDSRTI